MTTDRTVIWWIRRDLRLSDNPALGAALAAGTGVVPVFVLDPVLQASRWVGPGRLAFLYGGLRALDADLRARGGRLIVREGRPSRVLRALVRDLGAHMVFAQEEYSHYARRRDDEVAQRVPLSLVHGLTVHQPEAVAKADGSPYVVFTPYSRAWRSLPLPRAGDLRRAPARIPTPRGIPAGRLPDEPDPPAGFPPGEAEARRRLSRFTRGRRAAIYRYDADRDRMDVDGTSRLSPYLRFGMVSARQAVVAALRARERAEGGAERKSADRWLQELIWREFYQSILYHFPDVLRRAFRADLRRVRWEDDEEGFRAWQEGRTGYPVVDAGMRQLVQSGWMHNRARMIVGSFLVKDLLIDWRRGEAFFMRHLLDGDPASNNGGWQWVAGVGTDAAPYFRVFNPVLQGRKFDPDGAYVRRWVPELGGIDGAQVHEPWRLSHGAQRAAGCVVGRDYPVRIVDHRAARPRALARYKAARARPERS